MKILIIILLIGSCSTTKAEKECEFECIKCESVKFTCGGESKEFDLINNEAIL